MEGSTPSIAVAIFFSPRSRQDSKNSVFVTRLFHILRQRLAQGLFHRRPLSFILCDTPFQFDKMHCIRRAALRAAAQGSKTALIAPRSSVALNSVKVAALKSAAVPMSRTFSTTQFLANIEAEQPPSEQTSTDGLGAPEDQREGHVDETEHGLFVRNLVFDATHEHLAEAFSKYGKVATSVIARDARGLSRGYGFVYFTNAEDVEKAVAGANGTFWHGRRIYASPRVKTGRTTMNQLPLEERPRTKSLYIGNIPYETTDAELNKLFRSLEGLRDVRIAVDRSTGWPRGFAHADFHDEDSAFEAAKKLTGMSLLGRSLRVDFTQSVRRDGQQQQQHQQEQ